MNRDEMLLAVADLVETSSWGAADATAHALLAPDSPLVWHTVTDAGDVIDVRAALVAVGVQDGYMCSHQPDRRGAWLAHMGLPAPLAELCIRLAEEADRG